MFLCDCCCGVDRSSRTEQSVVEVDVHARFAAMSLLLDVPRVTQVFGTGHSFSPPLPPLISSSSLTILLTARFTALQTSLVVGSAIVGATLSFCLFIGLQQKVSFCWISDTSLRHVE